MAQSGTIIVGWFLLLRKQIFLFFIQYSENSERWEMGGYSILIGLVDVFFGFSS